MKSVNLDEYQRNAGETDQLGTGGLEGLSFMLLGLFGEVGTLLSALKKKQRDRDSFVGYAETVMEEFGDVLWYFSNIASRASLPLSVLAERVFRDLHDWDHVTEGGFGTFADVQTKKRLRGSPESQEFESSIINLAAKVGLLLNDFSNGRISSNRDTLSAHLVEVFRELIEAANVAAVDLDEAVEHNIRKINSRWPALEVATPLFDDGFDPLEQLPRSIEMHIIERKTDKGAFVIQRCNGINIGSQITDNKIEHDDYRFHDAFHLAYAGILGWSPVLRGLFKLKRKSVPKIDEAQDGQRAILIEEGISTLIFHRALRLNYFESINSLDYSLLKLIPEFVAGYEVEKCHLWEWEKAILEGFRVFRELRVKRRGIVTADLVNRAVHFSDLPE